MGHLKNEQTSFLNATASSRRNVPSYAFRLHSEGYTDQSQPGPEGHKPILQQQNIPGYEPKIKLMTKNAGNKIEITVTDNGIGISQKILDKIFQPFFTTKPTGQGTGLGLSLSYDIVKAHGGEVQLKSKEGEGSEFIIQLPVV